MDEGDIYFSPVISESYNDEYSRSPSSDGDFHPVDFAFDNPFESFADPWANEFTFKRDTSEQWCAPVVTPTVAPPVWKMDAPPVVYKTDPVVPPVAPPPSMFGGLGALPTHIASMLSLEHLQQIPTQPLTPPSPSQSPPPSSPQHRGKRRKIDAEREVVTITPPSTPPCYVTSTGEARLDLSREELLALTSEQFEDLVSTVRSNRDLTALEKREIKKQRRLIKNRESAHASRQRKKDYVSELEKKLADLARENVRLTQVINAIQSENTLLRSENQFYKARGQITSYIPDTIQRGVSFLSQQLQVQQHQQQQLHNHLVQQQQPQTQLPPQPSITSKAKAPVKTGGVLLMVLLFSFGVMFGNLGFPVTSPLTMQATPEVVVPRVFQQRDEYKQLSHSPMSDLSEHEVSDMMRERLRRRMMNNDLPQEVPSPDAVTMASKQDLVVPPAAEVAPLSPSVLDLMPRLHNLDPSLFKSNTTYLVCNDIHKFEPTLSANFESSDNSRKLSFLIPPSSLEAGGQEENSNLLVVTCEVTDVSMLPLVASNA